MTIEKLQERQHPVPDRAPLEGGENIQDRTRPQDWRDPREGRELIPPPAEGQR